MTTGDWKEWKQFGISKDEFERRDESRSNIVEMDRVFHVAHRIHAQRIIEDDGLRARLITDESKLRTERLSVTWVSPNNWYWGFRYGTVAFHFPWSTFANENCKLYKVEVIHKYRPPALRFLVVDPHENDLLKGHIARLEEGGAIQEFDPVYGSPIIYDDGKWYWRQMKWTYEFMIPRDFTELSRCERITFEPHHGTFCSLNTYTQNCPTVNNDRDYAVIQIICMALSHWESRKNLSQLIRLLRVPEDDQFEDFFSRFARKFRKVMEGLPLNPEDDGDFKSDADYLRLVVVALSDGHFDLAARRIRSYNRPKTFFNYLASRMKRCLDSSKSLESAIMTVEFSGELLTKAAKKKG